MSALVGAVQAVAFLATCGLAAWCFVMLCPSDPGGEE